VVRIYLFLQEYIFDFVVSIQKSNIPNSGWSAYLTYEGARKAKDKSKLTYYSDSTNEWDELELHALRPHGGGTVVTIFPSMTDYIKYAANKQEAATIVKSVLPDGFDLTNMPFMTGFEVTLDGIEGCRITRCGYTGEDGFELAMPAANATSIASKLLSNPKVRATGLGARDSLRLEAGLCLYGNDHNSDTNPIEATLGWTIGKK